MSRSETPVRGNRLLAALPRSTVDRLLSSAREVALGRGDAVYRALGAVRYVYFPQAGILSSVLDTTEGQTVEVGVIGPEGMAGLVAFHGGDVSYTRVYAQVSGCVCLRIAVEVFRREAERPGALRDLMHRYTLFTMATQAQSALCHCFHPAEARLAKWLLMSHDRIAGDVLPLTQQILSEMLGVQRPAVTWAARALQAAGFIGYRRARVTILDRAGLEKVSCECYRALRDEAERLLPVNWSK